MCIIVAVPTNVEIPSDEVLRTCFCSNPDGAGFMYSDGKNVRIRKGFMEWGEFKSALDSEHIPSDSAVVLHFRIATHGKVQPKCCHPFPISSEPADLGALAIESRFGIAHNGVIQGRRTDQNWSDSMDFVASVVAPLARMNPSFMHSSDAIELLQGACRSKLAIIDNAGDLALVGDFYEDGGVFYSNESYLPLRTNWSSYGSLFGRWDDASYYDEPWDDVDKLVENLPFEACQICDMAHECALWEPECANEETSIQASAYYSGYDADEVWEVVYE